jgi:hypothetical protein
MVNIFLKDDIVVGMKLCFQVSKDVELVLFYDINFHGSFVETFIAKVHRTVCASQTTF